MRFEILDACQAESLGAVLYFDIEAQTRRPETKISSENFERRSKVSLKFFRPKTYTVRLVSFPSTRK